MGGTGEFNTPSKVGDRTIGTLRIHENAGEVHFHDDVHRLKAAVPTATMYETWEKLRMGRMKKFKFKDLTNRTILRIKVVDKKKGPLDLRMTVEPTKDKSVKLAECGLSTASTEFTAFDEFIRGNKITDKA